MIGQLIDRLHGLERRRFKARRFASVKSQASKRSGMAMAFAALAFGVDNHKLKDVVKDFFGVFPDLEQSADYRDRLPGPITGTDYRDRLPGPITGTDYRGRSPIRRTATGIARA